MSIYDDLAGALSQTILGQPYDEDSTLPEHFLIDHLVDTAREYGRADIDMPELIQEFAGTGFDIRRWVSEMVEQGHYSLGPDDAP